VLDIVSGPDMHGRDGAIAGRGSLCIFVASTIISISPAPTAAPVATDPSASGGLI